MTNSRIKRIAIRLGVINLIPQLACALCTLLVNMLGPQIWLEEWTTWIYVEKPTISSLSIVARHFLPIKNMSE
jgi:hypothetical protein